MKKMKPHSKPFLTTKAGRFLDRVSYFDIIFFATTAVGLSTTYFAIIPSDFDNCPSDSLDILNALYFSTITFTTVGYGDIAPSGFGRLVAAGTAFSGLFTTALLIGKLSSERQSATLQLLHTSDVERRLAKFSDDMRSVISQLSSNRPVIDLSDKRALEEFEAVRYGVDVIKGTNRYVFFNAMQANITVIGNRSSFPELCKCVEALGKRALKVSLDNKSLRSEKLDNEVQNLIESCSNFFTDITQLHTLNPPTSILGSVLSNLTSAFRKPNVRRSPSNNGQVWVQTAQNALSEHTPIAPTVEMLRTVEARLPSKNTSEWQQGFHKKVAADLGISNAAISRYIDILKERGTVTDDGNQTQSMTCPPKLPSF
ncbi:ion channel [Pseudosulfitobacter sp. SM2401]|uniref:potassium channel family protein n=1 Tax=Pseudosulfitobacter sp. SM2401 TaxID=3350098 RepID=UPI0036F2D3D1